MSKSSKGSIKTAPACSILSKAFSMQLIQIILFDCLFVFENLSNILKTQKNKINSFFATRNKPNTTVFLFVEKVVIFTKKTSQGVCVHLESHLQECICLSCFSGTTAICHLYDSYMFSFKWWLEYLHLEYFLLTLKVKITF